LLLFIATTPSAKSTPKVIVRTILIRKVHETCLILIDIIFYIENKFLIKIAKYKSIALQ
jgi:hypothetical protein